MTLDDLSQMSVDELRRKANERLLPLEITYGDSGMPVIVDQASILSEAQFYIDEIERRKQARIARRDFWLEVLVIVLIGAELGVAIVGGDQQLKVLNTLNTSAGQQLQLLQTMNTSAQQTATLLQDLRDEQQQTLQMVTQMNGALQAQLGLNFVPELTLVYDEATKSLVFQNYGKANIALWGSELERSNKVMLPEPRVIVPATGFRYPAEDMIQAGSQLVPKGRIETRRYDVYLKAANDKKFTATYLLNFMWKNDSLTIAIQLVGIKPTDWH